MINETAEEESESIFLWKYDNRFFTDIVERD